MSVKLKIHLQKITVLLQVALLALPIVLAPFEAAQALELSTRSVRLSTSAVGAPAQHLFSFTVPSTIVIGSLTFQYCTNSPLWFVPCVPPTGLNIGSAVLSAQTGNTGFSIDVANTTADKFVLTRIPLAGSAVASSYTFNNIINPTTINQTTYVRVATFISNDGTGAATDLGAVAFATTDNFQINAFVPPFLIFCVGVSVAINCSSSAGTHVDIGELQRTLTATATMQFSGATNDSTGYTTFLNGLTMTSGNNTITALASNSASSTGTSQFGLNLRANSTPTVGLDPLGPGASAAAPGYAAPDTFRFVNGEVLTSSATATDFRLFTASYIVNVPANQSPGVYATTMTYTAVASF